MVYGCFPKNTLHSLIPHFGKNITAYLLFLVHINCMHWFTFQNFALGIPSWCVTKILIECTYTMSSNLNSEIWWYFSIPYTLGYIHIYYSMKMFDLYTNAIPYMFSYIKRINMFFVSFINQAYYTYIYPRI